MFKKMIDGISIKLNQVFGDGYKIYGDKDVKQGLKEPCFFIAFLNPSQTKLVGSRYSRDFPVDIHFFPSVEGDFIEMMTVAEKLMVETEIITLTDGDMVRGFDSHFEAVDGVLHFFITYRMTVLITDTPADDMETLTITQNTGEG